ncbi:hypothetical protein PG997_006291 [Apiospora hydei]|uniref:Uncharacterized protein n=1 Tax=Apiospora hydei TaxID=1337664 RepID=A0ABR1WNA8_9PEZI
MIEIRGPVEVGALEGRELADVAVAEPVLGHGRRVGREPHAREPDDVLVPALVAVARLRLRVVQVAEPHIPEVSVGEERRPWNRVLIIIPLGMVFENVGQPSVVALLEEVGSIVVVVVLAPDQSIGSDSLVEVELGLHHIKITGSKERPV